MGLKSILARSPLDKKIRTHLNEAEKGILASLRECEDSLNGKSKDLRSRRVEAVKRDLLQALRSIRAVRLVGEFPEETEVPPLPRGTRGLSKKSHPPPKK
jgi:hypothetical protein